MKKLMCVVFGLMLATGAMAHAPAWNGAPGTEWLLQEKVEVKVADLPAAIKKAIKEDPYTGWEITKAYRVSGPGNTVMYELELKKGEDMMKASFDENGRKIV